MNSQLTRMGKAGLSIPALLLSCGIATAAQPGPAPAQPEANREQQLAAARARLEEAAREVAELSLDDNGGRNFFRFNTQSLGRAALGINIGGREARRSEGAAEDGVPVLSVSPGGPAAEAGIRAGDVLIAVDGKALKAENGRSPQAVLLAHMEGVEPGATVNVEYRRDGKQNKVAIVARPLNPPFFAGAQVMPLPGGMPPGEGPMSPGFAFFRGPQTFGAIELVPLTPKLGQYFGTDKGLLVVRAPGDSRLSLEDGDVIVDIAGRVPATPAHAMRILESYQPGEKLALNVMRLRKKVILNIEIPADGRRGDMMFEVPGLQRFPGPGSVRGNGPVPFNVPVPPPAVRPLPPGGDERA